MSRIRISDNIFSAKSLATSLLLVGSVVMIAVPALAVGPSFNIFPVGYDGGQNTDYPLLDARNYSTGGSFSTSQADHNDGVSLSPGQDVEFIIYYHNGAADAPENTATNVRVQASLPSGSALSHTVSASISASNASTVYSSDGSRGGNVSVNLTGTEPQSLTYISGSTMWFKERSSVGQQMPDGIVTSGISLGDIRGCWNYAGFVRFRARIGSVAPTTPVLTISKTVGFVGLNEGSSYSESITVDPAATVKFRIVSQASSAQVNNTVIRDILPTGLSYVSNTMRVNGTLVSDTTGLFGSGYEYGTLPAGQSVEITFHAQVASASFFGTSDQTLTNTANVRGSNASTVQDTAEVRVRGQVLSSSFELRKSAYNQTQGVNAQSVQANSGDVITYTLTYRNTGQAAISNVVVEDDLSDVLRHADVINTGEGSMSGTYVRYPAITVPAGISIDKTFQVRVREIPTSGSDYVMTNIYGNQLDIYLRRPAVQGVYVAPQTGPGENIALALALAATAAWYIRRRSLAGSPAVS